MFFTIFESCRLAGPQNQNGDFDTIWRSFGGHVEVILGRLEVNLRQLGADMSQSKPAAGQLEGG